MTRLRLAAIAAAFFLLALPAAAAADSAAPQSAGAEQLLVPPYPATTPWKKITDHRDDKMLWYEWIPADQNTDDIHDILTQQEFFPLKGHDAGEFVKNIIMRTAGACRDSTHNGPVMHTELGYQVAYAQIYCVGAGGKDVDIFLKAISGRDALYIMQREFRRPADPAAVAGARHFGKDQLAEAEAVLAAQKAAASYLDQVKLCSKGVAGSDCAPDSGSQSATAAPPNTDDSVQIDGWPIPGKTTVAEVREKLGRPLIENHSDPFRRGEYTMVFQVGDGVMLTFLFDKNDLVVRMRAYKQNAP